jgi:hypothetical protein
VCRRSLLATLLLATGAVTPLAGPENLRVTLAPYSGMLFRFDKSQLPPRRKLAAHDVPAASN